MQISEFVIHFYGYMKIALPADNTALCAIIPSRLLCRFGSFYYEIGKPDLAAAPAGYAYLEYELNAKEWRTQLAEHPLSPAIRKSSQCAMWRVRVAKACWFARRPGPRLPRRCRVALIVLPAVECCCWKTLRGAQRISLHAAGWVSVRA